MPSTLKAVKKFRDAKILYAPSKASNAGGVATSVFEMSQNTTHIAWTYKEIEQKLRKVMQDIHSSCMEHGTQKDGSIHYVDGANIAGFIKVSDAMLAQGII